MFGWKARTDAHPSTQQLADECEARALAAWANAWQARDELRRAVAEAARTADAVARLDHTLRHLR